MTRLFELAIERLRTIPETEQDGFARFLLYELEEDNQWMRTTEKHEEELGKFVADILADDIRGEPEPRGPDWC